MDSIEQGAASRSWVRVVGEVAVIVAGIAIALGADAWWAYQQERDFEQLALRQLASEFEANAAQLDTVLGYHHGVEQATLILISARPEGAQIPSDSVRVLLRNIDNWWTFNPRSGALGSILSSGGLRSIRNDSLRVELAGWPGLVEDYQEDERYASEYGRGPWSEMLRSAGMLSDLYFPAGRDERLQRMLRDPEFREVVVGRWGDSPDLREEGESVRGTLERIRKLIDRELSENASGG